MAASPTALRREPIPILGWPGWVAVASPLVPVVSIEEPCVEPLRCYIQKGTWSCPVSSCPPRGGRASAGWVAALYPGSGGPGLPRVAVRCLWAAGLVNMRLQVC